VKRYTVAEANDIALVLDERVNADTDRAMASAMREVMPCGGCYVQPETGRNLRDHHDATCPEAAG
jgi:hypothetical protein